MRVGTACLRRIKSGPRQSTAERRRFPALRSPRIGGVAEDRKLREHLDGYAAYARKVRHRLVPGVW